MEKQKKKSEEQKYTVRVICDNPGHKKKVKLAETVPMTIKEIQDDWTRLVLTSGFNTPRCHRCGNSTFSDLNISTDLLIYDGKKYYEYDDLKQLLNKPNAN